MKKSEFNNLLKQSTNIEVNLIKDNQKEWEANVRGQHKDMTKTEVGFSNKQLEQLKNLIVEIVPPMIDQKLEPILNCPTIKKELNQK